MAEPKYRTSEYQSARRRFARLVASGQAFCVEPLCLMRDRWIQPGTQWHVSHDPTGQLILGPSHSRCNTSEGASRGNRQRGKAKRWTM